MNIFIDTEDMEERYGEQLYQDYLVEQNKDLQQRIDKAIEYINENCYETYDSYYDQKYYTLESKQELLEILKGDNGVKQ